MPHQFSGIIVDTAMDTLPLALTPWQRKAKSVDAPRNNVLARACVRPSLPVGRISALVPSFGERLEEALKVKATVIRKREKERDRKRG